jgi:hypothetical protein
MMNDLVTHAFLSECDLETRINHYVMLMHSAATSEERRAAQEEVRRLHALRSTDRVADMERAQRLR